MPAPSGRAPSPPPLTVSIVVPLYNEIGQLPDLIGSLRALLAAEPGSDVLLVDGGSSDGSLEQLRAGELPWISAPRGRAHQLNAGAAATRGQVLLFLHADTRLPAGALRAIREAVAAGFAGGFFAVRLDGNEWRVRLIGRLITLRSRLTRICTGDQAQWVRRDVFAALGGFAAVPLFEDLDLAQRLRHYGPVAPSPLPVLTSSRRWRQRGTWRTVFRMWLLRLAYSLGVPATRLAHLYEDVR